MKKSTLTIIGFVFYFTSNIMAQTTIPSGDVSGIWTAANSPYIVEGTISVADNSTLIIEPGVTVKFNSGSLDVDKDETLIAIGTPDSMIVFTSNNPDPSPGNWTDIYLNGTENRCTIKYAIIEYAARGIFCNAYVSGCSSFDNESVIENCEIRYTSQRGIYCRGGGSSGDGCAPARTGNCDPLIRYNKIYNNNGNGIYMAAFDGFASRGRVEAILENNLIFNNESYGVWTDTNGESGQVIPTIRNNTIINNGKHGIFVQNNLDSLNYVIENNIVAYNQEKGIAVPAIWSPNQIPIIRFNNVWQNVEENYFQFDPPANDISVNPNFIAPASEDFSLSDTSACIDAGNNDVVYSLTDFAGNFRIWDGNSDGIPTVDIGAFEYNAPPFQQIVILNQPDDSTVCFGATVHFSVEATGVGLSYQWKKNGIDVSGATSSTLTLPNVTTFDEGNYSCLVTDLSWAFKSSSIATLQVSQATATITGDSIICLNHHTTLSASGGGIYQWNTGSASSSLTVSPTSTTTYSITVTNADGCTDVENHTVNVNPNPEALISPSGPIDFCSGDSIFLTASGGETYLWEGGLTSPEISFIGITSGSYSVTVADVNGCTDVDYVSLNMLPPIFQYSISTNPTACESGTLVINASGGTSFHWIGPNGYTSNNQQVFIENVSLLAQGVYIVTIENQFGCSVTDSTIAHIDTLPFVALELDTTVFCVNEESIMLTGGIPLGGNYSGPGISGNIFEPSLAGVGSHTIKYSYFDSNCLNSDTQEINVMDGDCTTGTSTVEINESIKVYPNPSSGNFSIVLENWAGRINIQVFDTQGRIIHSDDKKSNRLEIKNMPIGIYLLKVSNDKYVAVKKLIVQ